MREGGWKREGERNAKRKRGYLVSIDSLLKWLQWQEPGPPQMAAVARAKLV